MYSLIWQSVMWRPGKLRFLIGVKKPASYPAGRDRQKTRPLAGPRRSPDSRLQSGYALLSSRIRRHFLILIDARFSSRLSHSNVGVSGGWCQIEVGLNVKFQAAQRLCAPLSISVRQQQIGPETDEPAHLIGLLV